MSRGGLYPIKTVYNINPENKNLFVYSIRRHISSPAEETPHINSKGISIYYILSGKYEFNNKILSVGDGFTAPVSKERYCVKAYDKSGASFVCITIAGVSAKNFIESNNLKADLKEFSHPYAGEIAKLISDAIDADYRKSDTDYLLTGLLYSIMSYHRKNIRNHAIRGNLKNSRIKNPYINIILDYIDAHYQEELAVNVLADMVHLTPNYLSSIFKEAFNLSLQQYIMHYRMDIASLLLANTDKSISDIAKSVGYPDSQNFSQVFKKLNGYTPSAYRRATTQ